MSEKKTVEKIIDVEIKWKGNLKFDVKIRGTHELFVDDTPKPEGVDEGPAPSDLLAAAVGACLSSSFTFCMSKARAELTDLTTTVKAEESRVEGRIRVTGINVTLNPKFAENDDKKLERCKAIFRNYCIVTESVTKGIPVNVTVET